MKETEKEKLRELDIKKSNDCRCLSCAKCQPLENGADKKKQNSDVNFQRPFKDVQNQSGVNQKSDKAVSINKTEGKVLGRGCKNIRLFCKKF